MKARLRISSASLCLLTVILLIGQISIVSMPYRASGIRLEEEFSWFVENFNKTLVMEHVKVLSSLGSRVTGYPGFFKAVDYVVSKLKEYGVEPYGKDEGYFEYFNVTIPMDYGSYIRLENGEILKAYALWPNYVNPCPYESPPEGDLVVYVGDGSLERYKGLDVRGKFVLMDFGSRWYYRFAIALGAKGVIYVPERPELVIRPEAEQKLYYLPLNFPRLYVPDPDARKLLDLVKAKGEARVYIKVNTRWESIRVPNVVGLIRGSDPALMHEYVIVATYLDTWSITPALAPGATDALGVAVFLEIARLFSIKPPKRSVILLALAGHWQSIWGAREYIDRHFTELGKRIKLFVGIKLAYDSHRIGIFSIGSIYTFTSPDIINSRYGWLVSKMFNDYLIRMRRILGLDYGKDFVDGILWTHPTYVRNSMPFDPPGIRFFDSEAFLVATYGSAFTYYTTDAFRLYQRTPEDTVDKVIFENVWPQAYFIICSLWGLLNEPEISLFIRPSRLQSDWGFATLIVQLAEYNITTAYFDPFSAERHPKEWNDAVIRFTTSGIGFFNPTITISAAAGAAVLGYVTTPIVGGLDVIAKPDRNGRVVIKGVKPYVPGYVDAYVINSTNGRIEWATDLGVFSVTGGRYTPLTTTKYTKYISVFRCASIHVSFAFNPLDYRTIPVILVYNFLAHGPMIHQSSLIYGTDYMAFIEPYTPAELILTHGEKFAVAILHNASPGYEEGTGFIIPPGETHRITIYDIVKDLYLLVNSRYSVAVRYNTYSPSLIAYHEKHAKRTYNIFEKALAERDYERAFGYAMIAWGQEYYAYGLLMDLIWQVIASAVYSFILLIPFALIVEKLLAVTRYGLYRILIMAIFFVIGQIILYLYHPGYHIATNIILVLISAVLMLVITPLAIIVVKETLDSLKEARSRILGFHFIEKPTLSAFAEAVTIGIENMRRRKLRTALTLLSIISLTFSLLVFSSISITPQIFTSAVPGYNATYNGVLIRVRPWTPLPEEVWFAMKGFCTGIGVVAPRGWLYPPPPLGGVGTIVFTPKLYTYVYAILAVTPEEVKVTELDKALVAGRWFTEEDIYACIVSKRFVYNLSRELGRPIKVGSKITLWGVNLTIVGIFEGTLMDEILDLDTEPLTPAFMLLQAAYATRPPHFPADGVLLVPYKLYLRLAPSPLPMGIALKPESKEYLDFVIDNIVYSTTLDVSYAKEGTIYVAHPRQWIYAFGVGYIIIPMVLVAFTILDLMLGNVYERIREIYIYNATGLSPSHISMLFLVETITYASLGGALGYLLGIVCTNIFMAMKIYPPGFYPNFSSIIVLIALSVVISTTLISTLYPASKASRLAIPSLLRRWRMPKPRGDIWEVPMPFVATSEREAIGVLYFIWEYLTGFTRERIGRFSVEEIGYRSSITPDGGRIKTLEARVRLAPYDAGIIQRMRIDAFAPPKATRYSFSLSIRRLSGYRDTWVAANRIFIDNIRKQFLLWRTLKPKDKARYFKEGARVLEKKEESSS